MDFGIRYGNRAWMWGSRLLLGAMLLIDDQSYENPIAGTFLGEYWYEKKVPPNSSGAHTYTWRVVAKTEGRPAFVMESVKCIP